MSSRVGVDTNVLLSFLTDRDVEQQARAAALVGDAVGGDLELVVHQTVVSESVYVLCNLYGVEPGTVAAVVEDFLALPGVRAVDGLRWTSVWRLWPRRIADFGDACLTAAARDGAFDVLATFDRSFARRAQAEGVATW